jgi:RNA polymerase sigma-70 factor (ECF subfamily)
LRSSDQQLVNDLQSGRLEALGELYDRHQRLVYRTALAITGDVEAAADLLQEVFLRLHRFSHRVDPTRPLEPWIYRVTVNQACTWVKRRRWMRPVEELAEWLIGDSGNSPAQQLEKQEAWLAIERAMVGLPLAQRTVIVLYYVNDLSLKEIADILDIPDGTVKSRLHYGRRALRELLQAQQLDQTPEVMYEFT